MRGYIRANVHTSFLGFAAPLAEEFQRQAQGKGEKGKQDQQRTIWLDKSYLQFHLYWGQGSEEKPWGQDLGLQELK